MLFALYMAGLGNALHNTKLGVKLGDVIITALFFAYDLVLISSTPKKRNGPVTENCFGIL